MRTILKKACYYPLVVFLLTIGYGLLKIDFSDTRGHEAYGFLYIFIVMWFMVYLYIVAYICILIYIIKHKQASSRYMLPSLIIFLIVNIISFGIRPFDILFGLEGLTTYNGVAFLISLIGMAISGHLLESKKVIRYFNGHKKISKALPVILPLSIIFIPILSWWSIDKIKDEDQKQMYQQILEKGYHAKGKDYQVKVHHQYPSGKEEVRVEYTLKDGAYEIYSQAVLSSDNHGSFNIIRSTYVNLEQDYAKLASFQVNSKAGQSVLKDYVNEINASLIRIKADDKFLIRNESNSDSIHDKPLFSMLNLNWEQEIPNELKESITKAKESNQTGLCEFDGWVSLKVPDLMSTGLLIPEIYVDYDWESNAKTNNLDWAQVNQLRREVEEKLISSIDYTKLIDGNYMLSGTKDYLLKVKSGKLVEIGKSPSRRNVDSEGSRSWLLSHFTEWK